MRTKMSRTKSANSVPPTVERMLVDAMDHGLMQVVGAMTPREYVAIRTMSPFEIGYRFKQLLRDEMYERRRSAAKRQQNGVARAPGR
ncbi:hypothetical protein DID96_33420 [Burkholderia sp. Bp8963]|nr:hypothetical protein DID96_33420 [Burkholderia sp. Bp8963]